MSSNATELLAHIRLVKLHMVWPPYALCVGVTGLQCSLSMWSDQLNWRGTLLNIQLLIERGGKFSMGSNLDTYPTVNYRGHDAIMSIPINISVVGWQRENLVQEWLLVVMNTLIWNSLSKQYQKKECWSYYM